MQTAQILALQAEIVPDEFISDVVGQLVHDIVNVRSNHTTCGIIGWRWELDILTKYGYTDVAYALITQTTYPSFGYQILNPVEPATTVSWLIVMAAASEQSPFDNPATVCSDLGVVEF